jgi:S-adenosylhomocysteine hydrolase
MKRFLFFATLAVFIAVSITGCGEISRAMQAQATATTSDAAVARRNLEAAEQNFEVYRRVVFYNGITGDYILSIECYLAIVIDSDGDLVVTVKTADKEYLKHYLGLSDNVTYFSEALASNSVSTKQYRVIFKPSVIIPTFEIK